MPKNRFILYFSAPSCSGKSALTEELFKRIPDVYLVGTDKLKWQLAGYHRDKHRPLLKEITFGLLEVVCKTGIPVILHLTVRNRKDYFKLQRLAKKYKYRLVTVGLTAPKNILIKRFRERVALSKKKGFNISVKDESIYLENLSRKPFRPRGTPVFDTSINNEKVIADKIIKEVL